MENYRFFFLMIVIPWHFFYAGSFLYFEITYLAGGTIYLRHSISRLRLIFFLLILRIFRKNKSVLIVTFRISIIINEAFLKKV